ncbi:MAG: hypothetical protein ACKPEQ_34875, partial [Dolichospermum sp.]
SNSIAAQSCAIEVINVLLGLRTEIRSVGLWYALRKSLSYSIMMVLINKLLKVVIIQQVNIYNS